MFISILFAFFGVGDSFSLIQKKFFIKAVKCLIMLRKAVFHKVNVNDKF